MSATVHPAPVYVASEQEAERLRRSALRKNAWRLLPVLTLAFVFN